ncbi:MAG: MBL fold metallo-hydrolase [Candidatus Nanoarchaeia archaeon]
MDLFCLGGFREVGRNALFVKTDKGVIFDYGVKVETGENPAWPKATVTDALLTHGHLDHLGNSAVLYKNTRCNVYATSPTIDYADLLLRDSLKISKLKGQQTKYSPTDIINLKKALKKISYGDEISLSSKTSIEIWDAGHMPGSCIFVLKYKDKNKYKKILYTGDFKLDPTRLVCGARFDAKDIDVAVMECTYGSKEHPSREESEKNLYEAIRQTVESGGIALLPVYAIRAAEILMILDQFGANWPVYLDGMAKSATNIALAHPEFVRNSKKLHDAVENAIPLFENEERNNAIQEPCVILTTGAAMEGGPIVHYMKQLYNRDDCAIIFTGYQIPRTAGRYLLDTGQYTIGAINLKVKMKILSFDFSAHAGRSELLKFVQKVSPEKVICMHGDYCEKFATEIKSRFGINAIAPKNGDKIIV